ncbi:GNAT family N-acetyltransferase [Aliikangiella coralliicola]|uniref:GNAT family N-acetyltransferase n=1 Tax=Aliikangiella coralliicola TaxID=2592383 RepID=A0A545U634_9GAMM|nr:GNAT family N-acetyltransferase [Aliikangiella coralliicola]TQV84932.1 GNAT family N-acetyltransferase [Aliikangiella coralliicola]
MFRKCTNVDKEDVWNIYVDAMQHHIEKIWGWDIGWQTREFKENFFKLNTSFILFEGIEAGYIQYQESADEIYVNMIVLKPEHRSSGLGMPTLNLLQSNHPGKILRLRCFKINEGALRFYQKNSFRIIKEEDKFYLLELKAPFNKNAK